MQMKLMLVDDHLLFLEGLKYLLETYGINVVGKARNGREALIKAQILKPDIILMDIRMPECDGLDALRYIKAEMPQIRIVMLTTSEEDEDLYNAIKYGASGYLLKNTDARELINMLEQVMNNEAEVTPVIASQLLNEFKNKVLCSCFSDKNASHSPEENQLTDRQLEILEMVAKGVTYKEVGQRIGLSERTVKYHMGKILERLHLENRAQVIAFAGKNGFLNEN